MRVRRTTRKPEWQTRIAKERIGILFKLAKRSIEAHPERSKKYVGLARKIGKRYNVRLSKGQKRSFCKKCNQLLIPGKTSKVRLDPKEKLIIVKCLGCNKLYRFPYKGRKSGL